MLFASEPAEEGYDEELQRPHRRVYAKSSAQFPDITA